MTSPASPPSDLELMMFHDGELDEARHREVEAYLQAEGGAKTGSAKLAGLGLLSSLVIESQVPVARSQEQHADAIASLVMRRLDEQRAPQSSRAPKLDRFHADEAAPANDNGRFIMVLAGLAAAAAAALFVWGRTVPVEAPSAAVDSVEEPAAPPPIETVAAALPNQSASTSAAAPTIEEADQPSVEVASVDFGAASGAVYYVPSDSAGQTTAVVWLKDE